MQNKQTLRDEIEFVSTLKLITQSYQEISIMKMQRIRSAVIKTRDFLESLSEVFFDVKQSYDIYIQELILKKKREDVSLLTLLPRNGKTIAIFISSNEKLLGSITNKVFNSFLQYVQSEETDIMILGKVGVELYKQSGMRKPVIYLDISDNEVGSDEIRRIGYYIVNYSKINVFYGKFENLITQNPVRANLSGENPFKDVARTPQADHTSFLFEPSVEKIMQFFETQVFTSLFKQTFNESQLSRHASRITAMEDALQNIDSRTGALLGDKRRLKRDHQNRRQIEMISGMSGWSEG